MNDLIVREWFVLNVDKLKEILGVVADPLDILNSPSRPSPDGGCPERVPRTGQSVPVGNTRARSHPTNYRKYRPLLGEALGGFWARQLLSTGRLVPLGGGDSHAV